MDFIKEFFEQNLKPWWDSKDKNSKIVSASVGTAVTVALIVSLVFIIRPSYETLYHGLETEEAAEVAEKLAEYKVSYRLENGGTTIQVPRKDIYDIRLKLASEGLPRSGSQGYEILDESKLGMTEFLQKINYRRALEGELSKSIGSINGVKSARVHIVIPEPRLFKEDKKEATASVILTLSRAGGLSQHQVEGIVYLIASSVEGLHPENVTVLDSAGRLLSSRKQGSELGQLTSYQLELKKHVEEYLEEKALDILDPVIGPGKSVVKVSALLNFEQVEQTIENFDPDNPAVRSQEKITESSSEENSTTNGKGTVVSNSTENVVTNYEINRTAQHVVNEVGNIERLWVSLVVDGEIKEVESGGAVKEEYVPRTQEELDRLANLVRGAIGFDAERNDVFEIENVEFLHQKYEYSDGFFSKDKFNMLLEILFKVFLVIVCLIILMKVKKVVKSQMEKGRAEAKRRAEAKEAERKRQELLPKFKNEPKLVDHMKNIAKDDPAEVAKVIRTMLSQD
ncbi:MAG: flagellar M-ring protein FliF [Candidatus Zixiibacteriota bacterium]|nr:MAG: flagellar M-ring protein FliF [candidate division Zixibacteria bacterium]